MISVHDVRNCNSSLAPILAVDTTVLVRMLGKNRFGASYERLLHRCMVEGVPWAVSGFARGELYRVAKKEVYEQVAPKMGLSKHQWMTAQQRDPSYLAKAMAMADSVEEALKRYRGILLDPVTIDEGFLSEQHRAMFVYGLDQMDSAIYAAAITAGYRGLITHDADFGSRAENLNIYTANQELLSKTGPGIVRDQLLP